MDLKSIAQKIHKHLVKKLSQEVVDKLQECQGVVSGSTILQQVYNETWKDSDINIFVPVKQIEEPKVEQFFQLILDTHEDVYKELSSTEDTYGHIKNVIRVTTFKKHGSIEPFITFVHLCNITPYTMYKFICDESNFSIGKNMFYYSDKTPELLIQNIHDVIGKQTQVYLKTNFSSTIELCKKYNSRDIKSVEFIHSYKYQQFSHKLFSVEKYMCEHNFTQHSEQFKNWIEEGLKMIVSGELDTIM